jgi:hypothetical protein
MSAPSAENGYQFGPVNPVLDRVIWNAVMLSIHQRLTAREALEASFEALQVQGISQALQVISETVAPQLQAALDQLNAVRAGLTEAEDAVAALIASQIPASSIIVTPTGGIASTNVQAALAELDAEKASATSVADAAIEAAIVFG